MAKGNDGAALATLADTDEARRGAVELLVSLEANGAADDVSLTLTDPDLPYETWEALGRFLGTVGRRIPFYIGDWLIFGEELYGEQASQGVDDTTKTRYSEAQRVTGWAHGTLMNVRSIGHRIPRERRRRELDFWMHEPVAALEPDDQVRWLQRAIDEGLNRDQLREAIRAEKAPPVDPAEPADPGAAGLSICEVIERAARLAWNQGQRTSDGSLLVPPEAAAQLGAALGEE